MPGHEIAFDDTSFVLIPGIGKQCFMQLFQTIMRDSGKHVVRQVKVLPQGENGKIEKTATVKDTRVGQPASIPEAASGMRQTLS